MSDKWISVADYTPDVCKRVLGWNGQKRDVVFYGTDGRWYSDDKLIQYEITHWQPLADPPKRESSFQAWLGRCQYQNDGKILRVFGESISIGIARLIWDAAIATSKQPDFVE